MAETAREMPRWRVALSKVKHRAIRLRRRWFPYMVWYDAEVDVCVTFSRERLADGDDLNEAVAKFYSGRLFLAEKALKEAGVAFDSGMGRDGRDWEWDYSLNGPVSVRFRRAAERPERRKERPRPVLATKDGEAA